jgi:hypothetical protein
MALIRLAFSASYHVQAGAARQPWAVAYPQQSTTVMGPSEKRGNFPKLPVFEIWKFPTHTKRVAMRLPIDRQSTPLPKRLPVGARYVVEGRGGEDGDLQVFSRYIVLPGGQRINVPSDPSKFASMSVHAPRGKRGSNRTRRSRATAKKIMQKAGTTRQRQN